MITFEHEIDRLVPAHSTEDIPLEGQIGEIIFLRDELAFIPVSDAVLVVIIEVGNTYEARETVAGALVIGIRQSDEHLR